MGAKFTISRNKRIKIMSAKQKYNSIIVGGGIAGLTAAAYLSREGQSVLLIEQNDDFGGLVSSFTRDGFHFEGGVRALESAGIILPMLEDLGIELDIVRSKVSVGVGEDILNIEDMSSIQEYENMLIKIYPESRDEILHFIRKMRKIMKHLDVLYGIENPVFKDIPKDKEYLFKKLLPWLPRFLFTVGKINRLNMPVEGYLEKIIKNPSLRDIISQHFFKGTPTFFALSYFSLYLDYFYPKNGVGTLADKLVEQIEKSDGKLMPNTKIVQVDAAKHTVSSDNGKSYQYENLVWAADLKTFYQICDISAVSEKEKHGVEKLKAQLNQTKGSESVFTSYFEVDLPLEYFREIGHGHFFYTPKKQGLGEIHRSELAAMLKNWDKLSKADVLDWVARFLELNTFEISIPGLKNDKLVPENKTALIISFLMEYEFFDSLKKRGWYDEIRDIMEEKLVQIITDSVYPKLKENIIKSFTFTPISVKNRVSSSEGAIVGWSFERPLPVVHKIQSSRKSIKTPLKNIYQAGQWAYSPAGVPMSILTGKLAADVIIQKSPSPKSK